LLWSCLRNRGFNVLVLAPAIRQSKITVRKITGFLPKLPKFSALKPLKTKVEFYNGSRIQAIPNSPETIRGESGVNLVYADEFSYTKNDRELYEAVVFSLATTNGRFLATSTPGSRESLFYEMCTDDVSYGDFSRSHVGYWDALEPNGPLKPEILEKLKRQFASDPWRWRREMEAEFADDADAWLSMSLITRCVDPNLEYIPENAILNDPTSAPKFFVAGVDIGQKVDHSAVGLVDKRDREFYLAQMKRFPLGTEYGTVIGYLNLLNQNLHDLRRIMIDQTGVGETFMEMTARAGLKNARGIVLTQPKKQDVMTFLKHCMEDGLVHIPYDRDLLNELNVERFELEETGRLRFSHPPGTHDDRLWAFALAIYYARYEATEYHPAAAIGRNPNSLMPNLPRSLFRH
jgi:phage FluMu gp28-like protein